jgi:sRNA-binding protein
MSEVLNRYQSHFQYQHALLPGVKRIGLNGEENGTVTEQEHNQARRYVEDCKIREQEKTRSFNSSKNFVVEKKPTLKLPINNVVREPAMTVKVAKPSDPLNQLAELTTIIRGLRGQPEAIRPFVVAGLQIVKAEIEQTIAAMEQGK